MENRIKPTLRVSKVFILTKVFFCYLLVNPLNLKPQDNTDYSNTRIIVSLKKEISYSKNGEFVFPDKINELNSKFNLISSKPIRKASNISKKNFVFIYRKIQNTDSIIKLFMNTGLFDYVEPDMSFLSTNLKTTKNVIPNDFLFYLQWALYNDGSFPYSIADCDIKMTEGWEIETGDSSIVVAIINSGINPNENEFIGRIWGNQNEIGNNSIDDDKNGYVDDYYGWDFGENNNEPIDQFGQGNFIAGIIGANCNNNIGYAGVDWKCKLMTCKIVDNKGYMYLSWMVEAIYYAVDNGARIINLAFETHQNPRTLSLAIDYAHRHNVIVVCPMGNSNTDLKYFPAGYKNTIAVGSTDPDDYRTVYFLNLPGKGSNYGKHIDVVAPGNYIFGLNYDSSSEYALYTGGTEFASAYVTGLISLLLAQDKSRNLESIREILHNTSDDRINPYDQTGYDKYYGYGRINAQRALSYELEKNDTSINSIETLIFPNPMTDFFHASIIIYKKTSLTVTLFNNLGEKAFILVNQFYDLGCYTINVDVSGIPKGMYHVKFETNDNCFTRKIIVQ
jgi:thermitase